jgi:hypothetical protein
MAILSGEREKRKGGLRNWKRRRRRRNSAAGDLKLRRRQRPHKRSQQRQPRATPKATQPASPVPAATAGGFLASIGKKVFHKPDCKSVPTIPPENLVKFGTREEATAAGKKPCAICKP